MVVGDKLGLRKVVVGVPKQGKMYGLDSKTGNILWCGHSSPYNQRDSRTSNELAQVILVYRHMRSTFYLLIFNPINRALLSYQASTLELDQALLLPELLQNTRPLLLVGKDSSATVFPHLGHLLPVHQPQDVHGDGENIDRGPADWKSCVPDSCLKGCLLAIRSRRAEEKLQ